MTKSQHIRYLWAQIYGKTPKSYVSDQALAKDVQRVMEANPALAVDLSPTTASETDAFNSIAMLCSEILAQPATA